MNNSLKHLFSQIPRADIQRSVFDLSHTLKTTFDSGYLVPILVDEALPGDTFTLNLSMFGRLTTLAVPVMDNIYCETFFFAIPYRLVWDNWQKFCGEQLNPGDSTDYLIPVLEDQTPAVGSIHDYFGLATGVKAHNVSSLWHRAYNLVYNEWFRDENLQYRAPMLKSDGPDSRLVSDGSERYKLLRRGKRHDYFTSCLPWPQKGPGVQLPLAGEARVYGDGPMILKTFTDSTTFNGDVMSSPNSNLWNARTWSYSDEGQTVGHALKATQGHMASPTSVVGLPGKDDTWTDGSGNSHTGFGIKADLSSATMTTINDLRYAFQVQRWYESAARAGTRYTEILRGFFGVVSPDARLQRPEYLGGTSTRIVVHPVSQQSATDSTTPQGNLAAFATMGEVQHAFTKSFTEHTLILGLVNVRADLTYQQGTPRMFSRRTKFDFYWPTFAHLGEQAVLNKEIYTQGPDTVDASGNVVDEQVFGYQERWAEYRTKPSRITGRLRSTAAQTLDVWHLAQKFTSLPKLNSSFIVDNPPISRVVAVQNQPQFVADFSFDYKAVRPMPVYSVPGLIDHF